MCHGFTQCVMSSVDPDIQLTWDAPGNNQDGRMPVLDLKVWMEQDQNGVNKIRFTYYEKPMETQYIINALLFLVSEKECLGW